jgi:hypothetical protein
VEVVAVVVLVLGEELEDKVLQDLVASEVMQHNLVLVAAEVVEGLMQTGQESYMEVMVEWVSKVPCWLFHLPRSSFFFRVNSFLVSLKKFYNFCVGSLV